MSLPNSRELTERAARGDRDALRELLVRHLPSVEAYVRLKAGDLLRAKESCSDLVQSFCVQAIQNLEKFEFRSEAQFRQWLFQNALHKLINKARHYRAARRDAAREVLAGPPGSCSSADDVLQCYASICTPSRAVAAREALAAFEDAFGQLPDDQREAIALRRIGGLSNREVAEALGRSEGAARNLVYRGLARLSGLLEDQ